MYKLFNLDAVEFLNKLDNESVDLMICDLPYESLEKYRKIGTTTRLKNSKASSNKWFEIFKDERFPELFKEVYRVLKKNSHFYFFSNQETMFVAKPIGEQTGFKFWKSLVWGKGKIGMGYHYRAMHEMILFFEKGKLKLNNLSIPDILNYDRIFRGYPTEKPVELLEVLVNQSSKEGQLIVDPFMGRGTTGIACIKNNRKFYGNDICKEAVNVTLQRFKNLERKSKDEEKE